MRGAAAFALAAALSSCATYAPLPLGSGHGADDARQLRVSAADMPLPALATHRFDPSDGLDATEVAMLAVAGSPDLVLKRDDLGIARAQAFAAGLLPDPQLALAADFPAHSGGGLSTAYNLGISQDVSALLTRSSREAAASAGAEQVDLELLWAEWQAIAQAHLLFGQVTSLRAQQELLEDEQTATAALADTVGAALKSGNLSYDTASAGLNAGADVRKRVADGAIALHQAESDLRALLGLAPDAPLDLVGDPYVSVPTADEVEQALADLPARRPDLLALQAGYRAQDAKLRAAILAQFPALTLGFTSARDTSAIYTRGVGIGISLPLFDRNRGNIAIETATRQRLKDDYDTRLLAARSDVQRLRADLDTFARQRAALETHVRDLDAARAIAEPAWRNGLLDWQTWLAICGNALAADLDLVALRQEHAKQAIALEALLGSVDLHLSSVSRVPAP